MPHQKLIRDLKQQHAFELQKLREDYEQRIKDFDRLLLDSVKQEEQRIKSAWTWKVGAFLLAPAVFIKDKIDLLVDRGRAAQTRVIPEVKQGVADEVREIRAGFVAISGVVDSVVSFDPGSVTLGGVLDTFTYNCFKFEFNILRPTCENWKEVFLRHPINALMVESAWRGNENSWKNQIGSFSKTSDINLNALLAWCREQSIPTIFWNKEDPVHFDYFIKDAKKFDYIFTTDEGVVSKYAEIAGHDQVFPLPFAAQPVIHNPVKEYLRDGTVCFAGTYYNNRYVERRSDMDILLKPSLDFGLEIYDRNFGSTGQEAENYRFPDLYQPAIKGRLEYDDMVAAYKRFKVFLNVNSVRNSSTMFARRVFELLSCGTPVISTYSKGIADLLGEDTVMITESEKDTRSYLENLLHDDQFWWKRSLAGMRKVMEHHTYTNRTNTLFVPVGLSLRKQKLIVFRIICPVDSIDDARYFSALLMQQEYRNFSISLILSRNFKVKQSEKDTMIRLFNDNGTSIEVISPGQSIHRSTTGNVVYRVFLQQGHYYGKNYLRDFALAIRYSEAEILGKASWFSKNGNGGMILENKGAEFRFVQDIHQGTFVINETSRAGAVINPSEIRRDSSNPVRILSIDPFNFLDNGRAIYQSDPKKLSNLLDL
jgi:spore maturation protein CgeB